MRHELNIHQDCRCPPLRGVAAEMARSTPASLEITFALLGEMSGLSLPPAAEPHRADELWRHTCFEAFIRAASDEAYYEFNVAPSRAWAAYRFSGRRKGMAPAGEIPAPQIEASFAPGLFSLRVLLDLEKAASLSGVAVWHVGLSAVIEEQGGAKSYWALAHPPGKPDFHHADCFALQIATQK